MLAVIDGREDDVSELIDTADPEMLACAVGGVLLLAGAVLSELQAERRAVVHEHLASRAAVMAGWPL